VAVSSGYIVRETSGNLRRNALMTVAAILTMAVSLAALGSVLIMREAINKASIQWRGGVELAIFLEPNVAANDVSAIAAELRSDPGVKSYHYVDKQQAYTEFKTIFGSNSTLLQALGVSDMPPSYRVVPTKAQDISELGKQFESQGGVLKVTYAQQVIQSQIHKFQEMKWVGGAVALIVMIGAIALIVNTIQLAIFARRREVAVMKLVGATNWFIRIPFMLEGLVHGLVGALAAFSLVYFLRSQIANFIGNVSAFGSPRISPEEAIVTGVVILVLGILVGVLGSAFTVRRFLAV
jgi:cell division transport system permease protein